MVCVCGIVDEHVYENAVNHSPAKFMQNTCATLFERSAPQNFNAAHTMQTYRRSARKHKYVEREYESFARATRRA